MKSILTKACLAALAACTVWGCAKSAEEGVNEAARRYFDAWLAINYPGAVEKDGVYVVEDKPGTGDAWDDSLPVSFVTYTVRTLSGSVSANTDEAWARQLGNWNRTYYYGEQVIQTGEGLSYAGVDAILKGMRAGGTRTAVIPSWMMTNSRYDSTDEYFKHETENSAAIYTFTLHGQTDDIVKYEYDRLLGYARDTWGVTDTLSAAPVFFKSHTDFDGEPPVMPTDTTVYINYIGRRVSDGQVFDTNIADTAKFYHIHIPSKTYEPVSVALKPELADISMDGSTNLVNGFKYGMKEMHPGESASFAFGFNLGYGSAGGKDTHMIPPYSALRFDVELVPKP